MQSQSKGSICGLSVEARRLDEPSGVLECKNLVMAIIVDGGVDLGGSNGAMSQKMLDIADVDPLLQQEGGDRVAEHVGS